MNHRDTALILITGVPKLVNAAYTSGKPVIYGGPGNGPAFIERSADIKQAVEDIIGSRTFDNGIVSASEQSIVVEDCIADEVRKELKNNGAYFLSEQESGQLSQLFLRSDGSMNSEIVGKSAAELARKIGADVPEDTKVLISEQKYVSENNPYSREKLCPVLAFYVERDWMNACEKCIELLVNEGRGHTLVIHSQNENVIKEAVRLISEADLLIVGGTSLSVYPAAGLIRYYQGNKLVLINKDVTAYDRDADLLINADLGDVFSQI
jgi:acyl-CoA reductase-like NAD-dependent aldehyde dehydrogenase